MAETFKVPIFRGLRPKEEFQYDTSYLEVCQNLYVDETGVFEAEKLNRSFTLNEKAQFFPCLLETYVLTSGTLYKYDDGGVLTTVLADAGAGTPLWSFADFGRWVVFINRTYTLIRNISTGVFTKSSNPSTQDPPASNWSCSHRGRLILCGSAPYNAESKWLNLDGGPPAHLVAWSKINDAHFQHEDYPDRTNMSGYMPMEYSGYLLRSEPLKEHIIIYGENGVTALTLAGPGAAGYGQRTIHHAGILKWGSGAVCTNDVGDGATMHYFVDSSGHLCSIDANLTVTDLWYNEWLYNTLLDASYYNTARMCYNTRRDEVLINFDAGETFVFGKNGLSSITTNIQDMTTRIRPQFPVLTTGERIIHSPDTSNNQDDIVLTTNIFNFGTNSQKYLWGFYANIASPDDVAVVIYYRRNRSDAWSTTESRTFNKRDGYFNAGRLGGMEFKLEFTVEDYTAFRLSDMELKFNTIGRR